jgi:hypothetical protein
MDQTTSPNTARSARIALGNPFGVAFATALLVPWTESGPRGQMLRARKSSHVSADLRDDQRGRSGFNARDRLQ